jgi:predicted nucleotide-binding protein
MVYFHVFVGYNYGERRKMGVWFNTSEEQTRIVAEAIRDYGAFWLNGRVLHASQVHRALIFSSNDRFDEIVLPNGKKAIDSPVNYTLKSFNLEAVKGVTDCSLKFLAPLKNVDTTLSSSKASVLKKKVFIVHGRDEVPALALQKHLRELIIEAEMFEDFKKTAVSKTVIETLEEIRNQVGFAFIIATPDDFGCLCTDFEKCEKEILFDGELSPKDMKTLECQLNTRARQNVVFEYGLFMGALGRDKVCCLLQTSTKERPSDLSGVLYEEFDKRVNEKFNDIDAKLKDAKIGLIK